MQTPSQPQRPPETKPATPSPEDIRRQLGWGLVQAAQR